MLKVSSDESKIREYTQKLINFNIIRAFEAANMNLKEIEVIKISEARAAAAGSVPAPVPPHESKPKAESKEEIKGKQEVPLIPADKVIDQRWDFQNQVFKPGYNLPTMTIEEFGELEKKKMIENTE